MAEENKPQRLQQEDYTTLRDLWYLCLSHWRWFIISLAVCLCIGMYYLLITPKTYSREASVLIKEDNKGNDANKELSEEFADIGLIAKNTNVNNEKRHIRSLDIVLETVRRLSLNVYYTISGTFHDETLYGSTLPCQVLFPHSLDDTDCSFNLKFVSKDKVVLSDFSINGRTNYDEITARLDGSRVSTPIGYLTITKTGNLLASYMNQPIHVSHSSLFSAAKRVQANLSTELNDDKSTIVDLTYNDVSTQRAEDILNAIFLIYNEKEIEDKRKNAQSTSDFIAERLQVIEKELGNVDSDISSFKSANRITNIDATSEMYLQQFSQSDAEIIKLSSERSIVQYISDILKDRSNLNHLLPTNSGITNSALESQIAQYNSMILTLNNHLDYTSDQNPIILNLQRQLSSIRSGIMRTIDNEIKALDIQINSQKGYIGEANSKITSNPEQARYLLSVERQQKVKENLYLFLLQKREENQMSQAYTTHNSQMIDFPHGSSSSTSPHSVIILLVALGIGIFLPIVVIFTLENMNSSVRGRKDLDGKTSIPFLGEIPSYSPRKKGFHLLPVRIKIAKHKVLVKEGSHDIINEAFRVIRTNIEFMHGQQNPDQGEVYIVASYNADSGKTFITMNLSIALAIKQYKVMVIDGDLRHASNSAFTGYKMTGLSDFLGGKIDNVDDAIVHSNNYPTLDFLPVGTIPPNPTELLSTDRFGEMLEELRLRYDYILIDCPPSDIMADTAIIEKHADRTIFVVRAGLFERSMVPYLDEDFKNGKYKNMSLVLNGTDSRGLYGYKYRYGYRYGYGYGYGYGSSLTISDSMSDK